MYLDSRNGASLTAEEERCALSERECDELAERTSSETWRERRRRKGV
jgi:hypothetical protein